MKQTDTKRVPGDRKRRHIAFICMLLLSLPTILYAQPLIGNILPPDTDYSNILPVLIRIEGTAYTMDSKISSPFEMTISYNDSTDNYIYTMDSGISKTDMRLDSHLNILTHTTIFNRNHEEIMDKLGYDTRSYYRDSSSKEIVFSYLKSGRETKSARIKHTRHTVESDLSVILFQAILLKGIRSDFRADLVSSQDAIKARMIIKITEEDDFRKVSPDFVFPERIEDIVTPGKRYFVFEMGTEGLLSVFVWTKWYFAYDAAHPHDFVAYWGGNGDTRETFFSEKTSVTMPD